MKKINKFKRSKIFLGIIVLTIVALTMVSNFKSISSFINSKLKASDDDWNSDSSRVYWKDRSGTFGGVPQKNYIHVFAFEGETIALGTNVYNAGYNLEGTKIDNPSHNDENSVDIVMYDLSNNKTAIDIRKGGDGHIGTLAQETAAKNMTSPKGDNVYKPYTYVVHETGVYTFAFRAYGGSTDGAYKTKDKELEEPSVHQNHVSAWNISVFDENGEKKTGRTYVDYLSIQVEGHLKEKYYIVTNDSYIYEMKFNDIQPWTFSFFANNRGITDSANGNIIYKSVKDLKNTITFEKFGVNFKYPGTKENDLDKNFPIFFEKPNEDLKGYMFDKAIIPDPATNLHFVDNIEEKNRDDKKTYEGSGGYFVFDIEEGTTAEVRIEFKNQLDGYAPVSISDVVLPHSTNYFYWDGKDGKGEVIPSGTYTKDDFYYTVTTKAGEVHFPLIDIEFSTEGTTFERINDIYDKNDNKLNVKDSIYDLTKNVIYYDDTAIYYGEMITNVGASEKDVTYAKSIPSPSDPSKKIEVDMPVTFNESNGYYDYKTADSSIRNGEYAAYNNYGKLHNLRFGDHSSVNNVIDYSKEISSYSAEELKELKEKIKYLDSSVYPVGKAQSSNPSVSDYGIGNYWTFIQSKAVEATDGDSAINIIKPDEGYDTFNLATRVFYDEDLDGLYDLQNDGDHLLSDINLNVYKETSDSSAQKGKTYVYVTDTNGTNAITKITNFNDASGRTIYELYRTSRTPLKGNQILTGLEYNKSTGTKYLYEVIRPNNSYRVTSSKTKGAKVAKTTSMRDQSTGKTSTKTDYIGIYALYSYDSASTGQEIQTFTVGGDGIDLASAKNNTITTIDVGYHWDTTHTLKLSKKWKVEDEVKDNRPNFTIFEISYNDGQQTHVYEERALSPILAWQNKNEYSETKIDNKNVTDFYISAEYYIYGDKVFKHFYDYDIASNTYRSFVGSDYYFSLSDYYTERGLPKPEDGIYTLHNIPDFDGDGESTINDFKLIPSEYWHKAYAAGTSAIEGHVIAPYSSVIDRNVGTSETNITITNSSKPGTIEILKYTGALGDAVYLPSATFRIYRGDINTVKTIIDAYDIAQANYDNADEINREELLLERNVAAAAVDAIQVDSATTRVNGRVAFSGLDPLETYTVRERFAPSGYRIVEEYYQVNQRNSNLSGKKFSDSNYCLVEVGNIEASGDLEIRKRIQGRSWVPSDNFSFNINFSNVSNVAITTYDQSLFSQQGIDTNDLANTFVEDINKKDAIIINYANDYATINKVKSVDTKASSGLLESGSATVKASLNDVDFPAAGTYTFTINENETDDVNMLTSPRIFSITVNVIRVLNDPDTVADIDLNNSHLEASVSKISIQENKEDMESTIFAGNAPTFINNYVVQDVEQQTRYIVKKNFVGRQDNKWLENDKFTFILDGGDDTTKEALREGKLIVKVGKGTKETYPKETSEMQYIIDKNTDDSQFAIEEIDFNSVEFPVISENGVPTTEPVIYYLDIKEEIPQNANDSLYEGIQYSEDIYTLKIELINAADASGTTDGIVDKITFELYKNYDYEASDNSSRRISICTIIQELADDGHTVVKKASHDTSPTGHIMTFNNTYTPQEVLWVPEVSKTLEGREWVSGDSFRFEIRKTAGDNAGVKIPSKNYAEIKGENFESLDSDTYSEKFPAIRFVKPGNYTFEITEVYNNVNGITVDSSVYEITVTVTDDNEGQLHLTFDNESGINPVTHYVNHYFEQGTFDLLLSKELTGRKWQNSDEFAFVITPDAETAKAINDESIVMPKSLGSLTDGHYNVTISTKDGDVNDGRIVKNLGQMVVNKGSSDTQKYRFTIQEVTDGLVQMSSQNSKITLEFNVSRELDINTGVPTGNLDIVATYAYTDDDSDPEYSEEQTSAITIPFVNIAYCDDSVSINKELIGRDWEEDDLFEAQLTLLTDNADNFKILNNSSYEKVKFDKNTKEQIISFRFYEPGDYKFKVVELKPTSVKSGLDYDNSSYVVTFAVKDVGGKLAITKTINKEGSSDNLDKVNFANVYKTGDITVAKKVDGGDGEHQRDFNFTMTLSDSNINGNHGQMNFNKGVANFTLHDGQEITATDLPVGISYSIVEKEANLEEYITKVNEASGIVKEKNNSVIFTNTRLSKHSIKISQSTYGNIATKTDWTFKIILTSPAIKQLDSNYPYIKESFSEEEILAFSDEEGTIKLVKNEDGLFEGTFNLNHNETITINNLPEGTKYKIVELEANEDGYTTTIDGKEEDTLKNKTHVVKFTNVKFSKHKLTIDNKVTGNAADVKKAWTIKILLEPTQYAEIKNTYNYTGTNIEDGEIELTLNEDGLYEGYIKLQGNQKITIDDLPYGTSYNIVTLEENESNYKTTYNNNVGVIEESEINVEITNERNFKAPVTLDNIGRYIILFVLASLTLLASAIVIWQRKRTVI